MGAGRRLERVQSHDSGTNACLCEALLEILDAETHWMVKLPDAVYLYVSDPLRCPGEEMETHFWTLFCVSLHLAGLCLNPL